MKNTIACALSNAVKHDADIVVMFKNKEFGNNQFTTPYNIQEKIDNRTERMTHFAQEPSLGTVTNDIPIIALNNYNYLTFIFHHLGKNIFFLKYTELISIFYKIFCT